MIPLSKTSVLLYDGEKESIIKTIMSDDKIRVEVKGVEENEEDGYFIGNKSTG